MPQNSGSSRFWQSIASKIHGRSKSRERASDVGTEEIEAEKKPQQLGLQQVNRNLPLDDKSSSRIYEVDIVAIHGLDGSAFGTWTVDSSNEKTHKRTSTNWITDFLPRDVPGARIFTYGYESHLLFSKSRATVDDFAQKLLFALKVSRQDQEQRPIIFITHSLGGIVCKQALILANEDSNFSILLDKTIGILFFGTPHRGATGTPDVGIFLGNVFDTLSSASLARLAVGKTRTDLLETLKANSQDLRRITKSFSHISKMLQIVTIFETEELKPFARLVRRVPPIDSALFQLSSI